MPVPALQSRNGSLLVGPGGGLLTVNDDGSCCCAPGGPCPNDLDPPNTCSAMPSTLTASLSGITLVDEGVIESATQFGIGVHLSGVNPNQSFTLTSDEECPTVYTGGIEAGEFWVESSGMEDEDGNPIFLPMFLSVTVRFGVGDVVSLTVILLADGAPYLQSIELFEGGTTRGDGCKRTGFTFPNGTAGFPDEINLDGGDFNGGYDGTGTI